MADNNLASLRNLIHYKKNDPDLRAYVSKFIYRWAKDESICLAEFADLVKRSLKYLKQYGN